MNKIGVGDKVILNSVPEWLIHDLPSDEQANILSCIGKLAKVTNVDEYGYYWIGFGNVYTEEDGGSTYVGNSFCVTEDCLIKQQA